MDDDEFEELVMNKIDKAHIKANKEMQEIDHKIHPPSKTEIETQREDEKTALKKKIAALRKEINALKNVNGKHELNAKRALKRKQLRLQVSQIELQIEDINIEEEGAKKRDEGKIKEVYDEDKKNKKSTLASIFENEAKSTVESLYKLT